MKRLLVLFVVLFTVFFSYTIIAQEMGSLRKGYQISFPEKVQTPLGPPLAAGTYTIGTGGYFPTIDSAFKKLSIDGVAGAVTLELINTLYTAPADTFGFLLDGPIPGAGATSRVTIKPAPNKNVMAEGNWRMVFTFRNVSYVTLDGVSTEGPTTLTVHSLYNPQYVTNRGVGFIWNSDHNIAQNLIIVCEDYMREGHGIFCSAGTNSLFAPDSNIIQNNFIKKAGGAIIISAYSANTNTRSIGNIIRGNKIGSETDSLIAWGILLEKSQNAIVENNIVQNLKLNNGYLWDNVNIGIFSWQGDGDIIRNNLVHHIRASGGNTCDGIRLSGSASGYGSNNSIYNNMVYDIQSTSTQSASRVAGIEMQYQNSPKVYYNSVYLSGIGNGANPYGSASLAIWGTCSNVESKNNILVNVRNESPYIACSIFDEVTSNLTSDYNDLYYEPSTNSCLVRIGVTTKYNTLASWQALGKDLNSITEMPHFAAPDLHINSSIATNIESHATPIAGITTDFDGNLRNVTTPDIGADEFNGLIIPSPLAAGTYSVGTTGYFPTIDSAFKKLSADGVSGAVTLELINTLYVAPPDSFGFKLVGPIPGAGPSSRVTIKPAANKNVTIEGSCFGLVRFLNTSYVTLDGVALTGATTLTIHTLQNTQFPWNMGLEFMNNSDHNVVQNTIFISEDYTRGGVGGPAFYPDFFAGSLFAPDSNLIQNNFIKKSAIAIYVSAEFSAVKAIGNIIRGNIVGSDTDSLIGWGIQAQFTQNTIIENNVVQNVRRQGNVNVFTIIHGINSYYGNGDIIRNNIVHNIHSNGVRGATGILLSGDVGKVGNNNSVYNNMVYDIQSTSTQSDSRVTGIQIWRQDNPKIYYNTVYLSGTGSSPQGSASLYISSNCTNVEAKNNIFVNTRDESPYYACAIYDYSASNLTSDYNDLYYEPNQYSCLVRIGSTNYNTLANWQATGKDLHSVNEIVNFTSPADLHINNNYYTLLNEHATPITGITADIDGQLRNSLLPDIGADEFDLAVNATNWQMQNSNFPADVYVGDFSAVNNQVCWAVGQKYPPETTPYSGYLRTTDGGSNWVCDTISSISNGYFQQIFAIDANTAYVTCYKLTTTGTVGVFKTTDGGVTWNRQNAFNTSLYGPGYIHFFDSQNGVVIGDPNLETYTTTNGGLTWNPVSMPPALTNEITWLSGDGIKAIGKNIWFSTGARLFKSTDKGYTWTIIVSEPQYIRWYPCLAFQDSLISIYSLKKKGATDHLYRKTTDGGATWATISNSVLDNIAPTALQHIPGTVATYIVSGGTHPGMNGTARTDDAGVSWSVIDNVGNYQINFPSNIVGWGGQFATNTVKKYVGPKIPVELTSFTASANGNEVKLNWSTATELNNYGFEIQRKVLSGEFAKVAFVKGQGTTTQKNEYTFADKNLTEGKYFYRLKQMDFDGKYEYSQTVEVDVRMLDNYALEQNYPNPFNPTTTIGYVLQEKSNTRLTLLNSLGEEIAVLVNGEQDKGYHKVEFDGVKLSSGVYFYKLVAKDFVSTKKMILIK